jgi:hypothetical protein
MNTINDQYSEHSYHRPTLRIYGISVRSHNRIAHQRLTVMVKHRAKA